MSRELDQIQRQITQLQRRAQSIAARGVTTLVSDKEKTQRVQIELLADETEEDVEHFQPAPISWSKSMSEMGPISVRSRLPWRISSWPAAKGMTASSPVPRHTEAPSGTNRAIASLSEVSLDTALTILRVPPTTQFAEAP